MDFNIHHLHLFWKQKFQGGEQPLTEAWVRQAIG